MVAQKKQQQKGLWEKIVQKNKKPKPIAFTKKISKPKPTPQLSVSDLNRLQRVINGCTIFRSYRPGNSNPKHKDSR